MALILKPCFSTANQQVQYWVTQEQKKNLKNIKAKIIVEGANGPTSPEAEAIFYQNGGMIVPDMYANAGGVTVSYFEWLKNLSHVAFGRMNRRFEENSNLNLVNMVEGITGIALTPMQRSYACNAF